VTRAFPDRDGEAVDAALPLLAWLSPSFPIGAFAYSHGVEAAVEAGDITDAATLRDWIRDLVEHGGGRNDALLLAASWRAIDEGDHAALDPINDLARALSPSRERHLETLSQGNAFVAAILAAWPCAAMTALAARAPDGVAFPVALGVAAAGHGAPLRATLEASLLAFVSNMVSACVRLGPIGQTDGQKVIAGLLATIRAVADFAAGATLDDIGGASFRSDIASMRHETQYSRLFRS
jgi:urease accessory protein